MTPTKQILVIEDNEINRDILTSILEDEYTVLTAENGLVGLNILRDNADDISLILLDIEMPVMDGYTFLDTVKADEDLSLIPIIVMTSSGTDEGEVEALVRGATDFLPKPYKPQIILHRVANIISLRENAALANQFKYDRLTGLYSKEYFCHLVRETLLANPDEKYSIICSNVENFKVYNDNFGMKSGDRLLQDLAKAIRRRLGDKSICGRYSADRFLFLRKRFTDSANREELFKNAWLSSSVYRDNLVMKWGLYEINDTSVPIEQMCDRAFMAVDSISGQYDKWLAVYDDSLLNKLVREQAITDSMETALQEGQFDIYFQPKYSLRNDGLAGAEALVRWIHPQLGFLSPGEFIPVFEKNGFISRLDRHVWEQVCMIMHEWDEKGYSPFPVSVNMSRATIYNEKLLETLLYLTDKYKLNPSRLHLELTESAYTENPDQIISSVKSIRDAGFIVEMDDFGSGYSSLNMLNQMKFDILKLDMKFIQNETAKPTDKGILRFIITLARWLNLSVVAEGVETHVQLERLQELGCDYVQGYFFSKPLPRPEFEQLMSESFLCDSVSAAGAEAGISRYLLIVDDDREYRAAVRDSFKESFDILEAVTSEEALELVREKGTAISAILLNIELPEGDGKYFLDALHQDPKHWRIPVVAILPSDRVCSNLELHVRTDDFLCKQHPLEDLHVRVGRLLTIKESREREQELQDEANRDYMTGLYNRRGLFAAMDALRQSDMPAALYLFDVDNLKRVNDRIGHDAGDAMLKAFSELLKNNTRRGDILCRYGGDEFVVLLPHINNVDVIVEKGASICREFGKTVLPDGSLAACSCGIALCGRDDTISDKLFDHADRALYRAKRESKGGCCLWDDAEDGNRQ
ncbi:MAG: EAL domain-containing protein [Lentihominibacter sp.]